MASEQLKHMNELYASKRFSHFPLEIDMTKSATIPTRRSVFRAGAALAVAATATPLLTRTSAWAEDARQPESITDILVTYTPMILGMSPLLFVHVVLSLIGIAAGLVVLYGLLTGKSHGGWIAGFLTTTVLTSVTGFLLPATQLLPSHIVGILSLVLLAVAIVAFYVYHLAGAWRWIYVASAVTALYFNVFVGVVQSFQKLAFLQPLAPTQSEPPFIIAQVLVLTLFIVLGILAAKRFRPLAPNA